MSTQITVSTVLARKAADKILEEAIEHDKKQDEYINEQKRLDSIQRAEDEAAFLEWEARPFWRKGEMGIKAFRYTMNMGSWAFPLYADYRAHKIKPLRDAVYLHVSDVINLSQEDANTLFPNDQRR